MNDALDRVKQYREPLKSVAISMHVGLPRLLTVDDIHSLQAEGEELELAMADFLHDEGSECGRELKLLTACSDWLPRLAAAYSDPLDPD